MWKKKNFFFPKVWKFLKRKKEEKKNRGKGAEDKKKV